MSDNQELVDIVVADLVHLRTEWDPGIEDHQLRRESAILRGMLGDGQLQRAWKLAGLPGEPRIPAMVIDPVIWKVPPAQVVFASAGGGQAGPVSYGGGVVLADMDKAKVDALRDGVRHHELRPLSKFIGAPVIMAAGRVASRLEVVKYAANKLGGTHFDPKRTGKSAETYRMLDGVRAMVGIAEKNAVSFELLSIGQSIAQSGDLLELIEHATGTRPPLTWSPPDYTALSNAG